MKVFILLHDENYASAASGTQIGKPLRAFLTSEGAEAAVRLLEDAGVRGRIEIIAMDALEPGSSPAPWKPAFPIHGRE